VELAVDHNDPRSKTFRYKFLHVFRSASLPTIIHIPGGPGQAYSGMEIDDQELPSYNHVYIDPRGIGCNYRSALELPNELLTTLQHAADIVELIGKLKLRKYALYGVSYGTVVATEASALIAAKAPDLPPPSAVVLEGILGRALTELDQADLKVANWKQIAKQLPGLQAAFSNESSPPLGISLDDWYYIIDTMLSFFDETTTIKYLKVALSPSSYPGQTISELTSFLKSLVPDESELENPGEARFYVQIGCQEVFDQYERFAWLEKGELVTKSFDEAFEASPGETKREELQHCMLKELVDPYDSAAFQIAGAKTYYFQGEKDPLTPASLAYYHRDKQKKSDGKIFVETAKAGHNPFGLQLRDCSTQIWQRIFAGSDLKDVVDAQGRCVTSAGLALTEDEGRPVLPAVSRRRLHR
jgi:pimeloyl-ACP methyl ester carboxylesterase